MPNAPSGRHLAAPADRQRLREAVQRHRFDIVELCRALVRIPTEDPPGHTRAAMDFLKEFLTAQGVSVESCAADIQRPNLLGRLALASAGRRAVLSGHVETLPVGDRSRWVHDPLGADIVDGRVYGRGAWDMKGGVAAIVWAALTLRDDAPWVPGSLVLHIVSDESSGSRLGSEYLLDTASDVLGDVAIVAEEWCGIGVGTKGALWLEMRAVGVEGHGGFGFTSNSAIDVMADFLRDLRKVTEPEVSCPPEVRALIEQGRQFTDQTLGAGATDALLHVSLNVGRIQGGSKINVTAGTCTAEVDLRLPFGCTVEQAMQEVSYIAGRHPGVSFVQRYSCEPTMGMPTHPWYEILQAASREVTGVTRPLHIGHGFNDSRLLISRGVSAAALGPQGGNEAAPDEFVSIDSLVATAETYVVALHDYLTGEGGRDAKRTDASDG